MGCACLQALSRWAQPVLFMSVPATRRQDRDRQKKFTIWVAVDKRKPTEVHHLPKPEGKPGPKLHSSSVSRMHLWKHLQNTLKLSLQLFHIKMMKYSGNQFILLTQVLILPNNTDASATIHHRISVSFFNIKLTLASSRTKNVFTKVI